MYRMLFLALLVLMAITPAFGQHVEVFVTNDSYDGSFGGLAGADLACTQAANDAGHTGDWTAWLSNSSSNAVNRILDAEYRLIDGTTVVASSRADLVDGTLDAAINMDELGNSITMGTVQVWTATASDGTNSGYGTCSDWSSNLSGVSAQIGLTPRTDATWTDDGSSNTCDAFNRLYCFAQVEVPVEVQSFSVE